MWKAKKQQKKSEGENARRIAGPNPSTASASRKAIRPVAGNHRLMALSAQVCERYQYEKFFIDSGASCNLIMGHAPVMNGQLCWVKVKTAKGIIDRAIVGSLALETRGGYRFVLNRVLASSETSSNLISMHGLIAAGMQCVPLVDRCDMFRDGVLVLTAPWVNGMYTIDLRMRESAEHKSNGHTIAYAAVEVDACDDDDSDAGSVAPDPVPRVVRNRHTDASKKLSDL